MAVKEPEFWLPPEFLTADDVLLGFPKNVENPRPKTKSDLDLCFPAEFPYDLCSSPTASTEAESDEDEFLAELTRRVTQSTPDDTRKSATPGQLHFESWLLYGSPQSTLARVASWSGRSTGSSNGTPNGHSQISSPTTPLGAKNNAWDLILRAAGQVARLKMNAGDEPVESQAFPGPRNFTPLSPSFNPHAVGHNDLFLKVRGDQMVKQQSCGMWNNGCYSDPWLSQARASRAVFDGVGPFVENGRYGRPPVMGSAGHAAALHSLHFQHQNRSARPVMPFGGPGGAGAAGMKRERSGTGVFLPRRYVNNNSNGPVDSGSKIDMMIARRNAAMLAQQQRNFRPPELAISHEVCLPQEWTY